jgi:hypothetical protein
VRRGGGHFAGAVLSKFTAPALQFFLLTYVGRTQTVHDVGLLALGSAAAFLAGALGDVGFQTSLSLPRAYYGVEDPPLVATRRVRYVAATCGSLIYLGLVGAGLGRSDAHLWLLGPLPFTLALSLGLSGAMNAVGMLEIEGRIAIAESLVSAVLSVGIGQWAGDPLAGACVGLTAGRAIGLAFRSLATARLPQSRVRCLGGLWRKQQGFILSNVALIFQGQADLLMLGMLGTVALAAAYAPILRLAYTAALLAEALAWALFFRERRARGGALYPDSRLGRHPVISAASVGTLISVAFVAGSPAIVHLISPNIPVSPVAVVLLGLVIPVRFAIFALSLDIVRHGRQVHRVPSLVFSSIVLAAGTLLAAAMGSAGGVATARLMSEILLTGAFGIVARRVPALPG